MIALDVLAYFVTFFAGCFLGWHAGIHDERLRQALLSLETPEDEE